MITTSINITEFIKKFENNSFGRGNFSIHSEITIKNENIKSNFTTLNNLVFRELITISQAELKSGLAFINCQFDKGIIFENCTTNNYDSQFNPYKCSVHFSSCTTYYLSFNNNCFFNRGINLVNSCSIGTLSILNSTFKQQAFKLSDSEITRLFDIKDSIIYSLSINKSKIKDLRTSSTELNLSFFKSTFQGLVQLWGTKINDSLALNQNTFEQEFEVKASNINNIFIHGDTFIKKAKLENRDDEPNEIKASLNSVYISEANFLEGFELDGMGKELNKLELRLSPKFTGILRVIGWKIFETSISGINENLKLIFKKINFKRLTIIDFSNSGDITFESSSAENKLFKTEEDPDSSIIASDSSFGLTKFNEFDFNSFDFIDINNVSFNGIEASNVIWFEDKKLRIKSEDEVQDCRRRRELYRQIKHTLKSKGNQIDSLIFQAREIYSYRNELKKSRNYSVGNRIIMFVSQTNDYGLNWIKPTLLIISITLTCYIIGLPLFTKELWYNFDLPIADLSLMKEVFIDNLSVLANMFNPARRFSDTYGENVSTWLYFLDLLHRLILGIFIFQIIKAFRRLTI